MKAKPKTITAHCHYCQVPFEAKLLRTNLGYAAYCPSCVKRRVWMRDASYRSDQR